MTYPGMTFTRATLHVRLALNGYRYLMRNWFMTSAFIGIGFVAVIIMILSMTSVQVIRPYIKEYIL